MTKNRLPASYKIHYFKEKMKFNIENYHWKYAP